MYIDIINVPAPNMDYYFAMAGVDGYIGLCGCSFIAYAEKLVTPNDVLKMHWHNFNIKECNHFQVRGE